MKCQPFWGSDTKEKKTGGFLISLKSTETMNLLQSGKEHRVQRNNNGKRPEHLQTSIINSKGLEIIKIKTEGLQESIGIR